jgi:hypothetical protein
VPDAAPAGDTPPDHPAPPLDPADPRNDEVDATVLLTTGERITGVLIEDKVHAVKIRVGGIATTFTADQIDQVQKSAPFRERYKLFSESAGNDPEQILKVADWLAARERYELALYEVERALAVSPANVDIRQRKDRLTKQLELIDKSRRAKAPTREAPSPSAPGPARPTDEPAREVFPLLTPEQVNVMRIYEVDLRDPPNMVIERATIQRMMDAYAGNPLIPVTREGRDAFFRKRPAEILDVMFRLRARELYPEVKILETPQSIRRFRDDVERAWLINSCATTDCHGGAQAGRLRLTNRRAGSDASVATNLLIIDRFRLDDGSPLVDYDRPSRSPLLQFALPRGDALRKHPPVPVRSGSRVDAVKPVFRDANDRRYQLTLEWIKSMYSPRPQYPISYTPPGSSTPPAPPTPAPGIPAPAPSPAPGGGASPSPAPAQPGGSAAPADPAKTPPAGQPVPR